MTSIVPIVSVSGEFCILVDGIAFTVKVADGSRFEAVISIVSPNKVRL